MSRDHPSRRYKRLLPVFTVPKSQTQPKESL
jgi:hypothetical protein